MTEIIAVDIGGTHARFARASLAPGVRPQLGEVQTYRTADHGDIASAWRRFVADEGGVAPRRAAIAVAAPIDGGTIHFTNSPWVIQPRTLAADLELDDLVLLNDFGAVAHAVAWLDASELAHVAGPSDIAADGVTTIAGLGTGLGVAQLLRRHGRYFAIETEGGHGDFAPLDPIEQQILDRLRARFTRVSTERIASGPGLANIHEALAAIGNVSIRPGDDATLWRMALDGSDTLARQALDRLILSFGSVLGDLALAHGAHRVVIVGGLAQRVQDHLRAPAFHARFCAKGRYAPRMARFPILLALHEQPGLLGAAAAYLQTRKPSPPMP